MSLLLTNWGVDPYSVIIDPPQEWIHFSSSSFSQCPRDTIHGQVLSVRFLLEKTNLPSCRNLPGIIPHDKPLNQKAYPIVMITNTTLVFIDQYDSSSKVLTEFKINWRSLHQEISSITLNEIYIEIIATFYVNCHKKFPDKCFQINSYLQIRCLAKILSKKLQF